MDSVVVLNSQYQYNSEIPLEGKGLKKLINWLEKNKVEVLVEREDREIRGVSLVIKVPAVVRLLKFVGYKSKGKTLVYRDKSVYERDRNFCQYWHYDTMGKPFKYLCKTSERTIDHVIPKSMGGRTSYENCVTACKCCNVDKKKNLLPAQAGLKLIKIPETPLGFKKGDMVVVRFDFNPERISHRFYVEKILGSSW